MVGEEDGEREGEQGVENVVRMGKASEEMALVRACWCWAAGLLLCCCHCCACREGCRR